MTAVAWWLEYRHPSVVAWSRSRRCYFTRDDLDDAQRGLRHEGFETRVVEAA